MGQIQASKGRHLDQGSSLETFALGTTVRSDTVINMRSIPVIFSINQYSVDTSMTGN